MSEPFGSDLPDEKEYYKLQCIKYMTNYFNAINFDDVLRKTDNEYIRNIKSKNESYLKIYYNITGINLYPSKVIKQNLNLMPKFSDLSTSSSENSSLVSSNQKLSKERLKIYEYIIGNFSYDPEEILLNNFRDAPSDTILLQYESDTEEENIDGRDIYNSKALSVFHNYYDKLLNLEGIPFASKLKENNIWIPVVRNEYKSKLGVFIRPREKEFSQKKCPLFIEGTDYIPPQYDTYHGSAMISSYFGSFKLPSLVYHSSVQVNDVIHLFGGLLPCYKYDEEAPSLEQFRVKHMSDLPPPLLPNVINNPAMIVNPYLYTFDISSNRLQKQEIHGQLPPPLVCLKGTRLTDRYIFYYGGFELKTTWYSENGIYYLEKNIYLNPNAYILDIVSFNCRKVDIIPKKRKASDPSSLLARFGHCQISLSNVEVHNIRYAGANSMESHHDSLYNPTLDLSSAPKIPFLKKMHSRNESLSSRNDSNHKKVYYITMLIFGGYVEGNNQEFCAVNDMWKINLHVISRGKRGFLKFADSADAFLISPQKTKDDKGNISIPEPRGFGAYCIPGERSIRSLEQVNQRIEQFTPGLEPESSAASETTSTASPASSSALLTSQLLSEEAIQKPITENISYKTLLYQGGSNKTNVFGDMWSFDLEKETWTRVPFYARTSNDITEPKISIDFPIVGNCLFMVGNMILSIGGVVQADVDRMYSNDIKYKNYYFKNLDHMDNKSTDNNIPVGGTILNIFDLRTNCLQGCNVKKKYNSFKKKDDFVFDTDATIENQLFASIATTPVQINGTIVIIGGLIAAHSQVPNFYFRSTILKCVLPSMNLAS